MKHRIWVLSCTYLLLLAFFFSGCHDENGLDPKNPVTLTMWHNYGGQMKNLMDEMIDEFNRTAGAEKGILISVTAIAGSDTLHEKLMAAANGDPGAPALPDLTVAYPKTALALAEKNLLVDLSDQFTEEELSAYLPRFLEEGRIGDGLFVFPVAKSTEVLFVNQTLFDPFASETGVTYDDLSTLEGILRAADQYHTWTDEKTPDIPHDGKAFYMPDSLFNMTMIGMAQLGESFVQPDGLLLHTDQYKRIWDSWFPAAVRGSVSLFDGYSTDLFKTGDLVCSTGSTAGIVFYPEAMVYADNTRETIEYAILPYPVMAGGNKIALQRGGGMCVINTTRQKEKAAAVFLKWFTAPEQNLRFTASTGYLPVTEKAFGEAMDRQIAGITDAKLGSLLKTVITMQQQYDFFIPPLTETYDELQKDYGKRLKEAAKAVGAEWHELEITTDKEIWLEMMSENQYGKFVE